MAVFELRLAARSGPPGSMYAYDYAAVARAQLQFLYSKHSAQHSLPLEPWPWLWPSMVVAANPLPRATAGPMATPLSGSAGTSGTISGGGSGSGSAGTTQLAAELALAAANGSSALRRHCS